ncbi:hypothetical protein N8T08_007972 [Aspergillus melleus]|uniref:Uncharacterized protein n=1 Tax=Aspergillus melleus TaxID=138277 RepID=A0ACC3AWW3_9EURO|nr:hypothetical protein N8T08_007972 [Aspergillus melleus]
MFLIYFAKGVNMKKSNNLKLADHLPPNLEYLSVLGYKRGVNTVHDDQVDGLIALRHNASSKPREISGIENTTPNGEDSDPHVEGSVPCQQYDKRTVDEHISSLPKDMILKCLNIFNNKFPELGILHMPSVIRELECTRSEQTKALLGAVLVVTKPHGIIFNPAWVDGLLDADTYAIYTREMLSGLVLEPPSIQVVQSLLVIALHEWGSRNFHKAWVYCGIAIRIMQAIHSVRVTRYPLDTEADTRNDVMSVAIENRVFWACFIMDRMVSSGTYNPPMLPMSEMEKLGILRPLSTVEFAFGTDLASHSLGIEESLMRSEHHPTGLLDITQSFEILVSGFDIWAQVMTFILNDGRRAPGIVVAHMSLGYGESFTYSNLLYYVSTLMLHREYFPFLPLNETGPRGPIDHPTLEAEAPPGWWEESAKELFGAAEHIALLLQEASECGVSLYTPFIGFCAFSAAFNNIYVHRFPQMNLGRSLRAEQGVGYCLAYLSEFRKFLPVAGSLEQLLTSVSWQQLSIRRSYTNELHPTAIAIKGKRELTSTSCINPFMNFV